jgi:hypothetical protein
MQVATPLICIIAGAGIAVTNAIEKLNINKK